MRMKEFWIRCWIRVWILKSGSLFGLYFVSFDKGREISGIRSGNGGCRRYGVG